MAINPLLLNVKPISEITTVDNPIKGHLLFYDGSDELKKVDIIKFQSLIGGIAKPLAIADATPTTAGWYKPTTSGTYANAGGLVAQEGYDTLFYFDGTTWIKVEVAMPNYLFQDKQYIQNGNVVLNNLGQIQSMDIKWADGVDGTLVNSQYNDFVMEYEKTTVTHLTTTILYTTIFDGNGNITSQTITIS